jgi:hypothetical protein
MMAGSLHVNQGRSPLLSEFSPNAVFTKIEFSIPDSGGQGFKQSKEVEFSLN